MLSNSKCKDSQERNCRMIIQDSKASPEISAEPDMDFRELREQVVCKGRGALLSGALWCESAVDKAQRQPKAQVLAGHSLAM